MPLTYTIHGGFIRAASAVSARSMPRVKRREGHNVLDRDARLGELQRLVDGMLPRLAELTEQICLVPAPTHEEAERAKFVATLFEERGFSVEMDDLHNVYARRRGTGDAPTMMLAAHTDTVFPAGTPISVERRNGQLIGPGIGDNSLGVAGILVLADLLEAAEIQTPGDVLFVANVGEEGLGNLRGIRAAVDRFEDELGAVIAVEGHNLGRVTHMAVGSKRIRVTVYGPGGHSWGAFGEPSAIHELAGIITDLTAVAIPSDPRTTYNVGLIEGGVSVNTIAPKASAVIDMRSVDPEALAQLDRELDRIIRRRESAKIKTEVEILGERPAGVVSPDTPLVQTAMEILRELDLPAELNASSTDANIPIARGIPAICIGLTHGTGAHRVDEMIEIGPAATGVLQLALLVDRFPVGGRGNHH